MDTCRAREKINNNSVRPMERYCRDECLEKMVLGKLQCQCGEDFNNFEWRWAENDDSAFVVNLSNHNRDVLFHPIYSAGTAYAKGLKPLQQNRHHFFEIKMLSHLYGTDVMVGLSTMQSQKRAWLYRYCSYLGIDRYSWGYSYVGLAQHDGKAKGYGPKFDAGCLIGVHVDMYKGTVEFLANRRRLGIAFRNLKHHMLYPIVSSTAAQSAIRLTCSMSCSTDLQLLCYEKIVENEMLHERLKNIPFLISQLERKFPWVNPKLNCSHYMRKRGQKQSKEDETAKRRCMLP